MSALLGISVLNVSFHYLCPVISFGSELYRQMMIVKLKFRQQKTLTKQGSIKIRFKTNYLIASFNALPDTNAGTLDAAILISAPVCGLRPVRAARLFTLNVPKPIN